MNSKSSQRNGNTKEEYNSAVSLKATSNSSYKREQIAPAGNL